jgi:hypothetical protein
MLVASRIAVGPARLMTGVVVKSFGTATDITPLLTVVEPV